MEILFRLIPYPNCLGSKECSDVGLPRGSYIRQIGRTRIQRINI